MSRAAVVLFLFVTVCAASRAQTNSGPISASESAFQRSIASDGPKAAFTYYLLSDAVLFKPNAIKGVEYYRSHNDLDGLTLVRRETDADVSSNGLLGYTTGDWRLYEKGKSEASAKFGQFVTIWKKDLAGQYRIALDIGITHDKLTFDQTGRILFSDKGSDPNTRGWSPADASMNFFRTSMAAGGLEAGYRQFAADDIRLLVEKEPPILGKKRALDAVKGYRSIEFPRRVMSFASADMAYTWNPCEFDNYGEGTEKGNCVHVWKLRDKKWWIVLGVFARVSKTVPPRLLEKRAGQ